MCKKLIITGVHNTWGFKRGLSLPFLIFFQPLTLTRSEMQITKMYITYHTRQKQ